MIPGPQSLRCLRAPLAAAAILLSAAAPLCAAVTTVYSCAGGGDAGQHDYVFNGFYVQNVHATDLHTAAIAYRTDQDGLYTVSLTVRRGSYSGPVVGTTQTQTVSLSSSTDKVLTWSFGDAPITSGDTLYFLHSSSGTGNVYFSLSPRAARETRRRSAPRPTSTGSASA